MILQDLAWSCMILQDDHDLTRSYKMIMILQDLTRLHLTRSYKILQDQDYILQDYILQDLTRSCMILLHLTRSYKILPYKIL